MLSAVSRLEQKIRHRVGIRWHYLRWGVLIPQRPLGWVCARWGGAARFLRNPLPWRSPHRRKQVMVARHGGLGDVLMVTPGLRELKRLNPDCHITFFTPYGDLLQGIPYIDEVRSYDPANLPRGTVRLWIEDSMPPRRHIAEMMADHIGVEVRDIKPDCAVDERLVGRYREQWEHLPRPWIVVNRHSAGWVPNKEWFDDRWEALIASLDARATIIEIGNKPEEPADEHRLSHFVDLRGQTSLKELAAAIAAGDILISPGSGPTHIAAAVGTPCVVILGGYEKPHSAGYEWNIHLSTDLTCSPCFLGGNCPYDKECMRRITPEHVAEAVDRLWARQAGGD
jgi:ADP-heptose:LPS heptosyltransferase